MAVNEIYQYSIISALMDGVASTGLPLRDLLAHGDHGLGTFRRMFGEMIVLDGRVYQMKSDGTVSEVDAGPGGDAVSPFAMVTRLRPTAALRAAFNDKKGLFDRLTQHFPGSRNFFLAIRIDGVFRDVTVRTARGQSRPGESMLEVGRNQASHTFAGPVRGTVVGFRSPEYTQGISLLRRAHYARPLFPRGARAEAAFAGWAPEDFLEVTCAFRATLNWYAVPVAAMLDGFAADVGRALGSAEARRVEGHLDREERGVRRPAVGAQPAAGGPSGAGHSPLGRAARQRVFRLPRAARRPAAGPRALAAAQVGAPEPRRVGRPGLQHLPAERDARRGKRGRSSSREALREAHPELEMSKFFHVLCSLPLRFLDRFLGMSERWQRRFLKSVFHAVSRVKASHAPMFLSGEVRAWSSKPADETGRRNWDHTDEHLPRIFPELAVRSVSLACLSRIYKLTYDRYHGWEVRTDAQGRAVWMWDDDDVTPLSWAHLPSRVEYKPYPVDGVLGMSPESWRAVWRSDRQAERLAWTGPGMDRPRWEGYGRAGRPDPDECRCHFGQACALCTPLPFVGVPEWELLTAEERRAERALNEYLRDFKMELAPRAWTSPARSTVPVDEAAAQLLSSLSTEFVWDRKSRSRR
ncbi:hypothetical protein CPLU01_15160 [Colletotrichum plurivorum]|uniref:Alpha-acetolactate decarboxylase n=1 Tax=Colletotrichum plurivorum TaxID=2175906 RepID=A0A8H6JDR0_9PEZI|nr:hypothetical protein CPLU01_15160 [Colletotrichum plurivorum]